MTKNDKSRAIRKLAFELMVASNETTNLNLILERLFALLQDYNELPLEPHLAIVLANPRGRFLQVAQFGFKPAWETDFRWHSDLFEQARPYPGSAIRSLFLENTSGDGSRKLLVLLPLALQNRFIGYVVLCVHPAYFPPDTQIEFLADLTRVLSGLVQRTISHEVLQIREYELEQARADALRSLGVAAEFRDNETGWHIMRMTNYALAIAKAMHLPEEQRNLLYIAAPMHDVGKIGIADAILLKPGRLTPEEFEIMKTHTEIGIRILEGNDALIETARQIAGSHHERWNGSGYPQGLKGNAIPMLARICAVADVFDALTSARPYKTPWSIDDACTWIAAESGKHFDPDVARAFAQALPDILRIRELYNDNVIDPKRTLALPALPPRKNSWVSWDDSLRVGIDVVDAQHRYLFDLINDLFEVVTRMRGAREIARLINATDSYARVHFRAEEEMMAQYGYQDIQRQQQQHQAFETKIREFYEELHENPLVTKFDVLAYLRDWLVHHIRVEDVKLQTLANA